ncbi:MAG: phytanoyl-CoA dioxygenase family protein [Acidobacteria bacterium]|nr:phytanoyl-CoA dioxygenase family protein [Acidobacteriota bacterium]
MTETEKRLLDEQGYLVLEGFIDADWLRELRLRLEELFEEEGENAGHLFRREPFARHLSNLVDKGQVFERVVSDPQMLVFVNHVLGGSFKLGSLNARSTNPHAPIAQPLHCDMDVLPDEQGARVFNAIWLLDDFTSDNGATRVVPGSHLWGRLPQKCMPDAKAPYPNEVVVTAPAGSVLVYNAHLWHSATSNHTARHRRALHALYVRRDLPQQQWQAMCLRAETQQRMEPLMRYLLALDDAYNDKLCAEAETQHVH